MSKGYTFVEILVVTAVMAIVAGGLFMFLSSQRQSWYTLETRTALQMELRKALSRMTDDLRQTSMSQIVDEHGAALVANVPYAALYFKVPQSINNVTGRVVWNSTMVSYTLANGTVLRSGAATPLTISSSITGLNFTRLGNDVIQIDVSGLKTKAVEHGTASVNATLRSAVAVRN